MLCGVPVPHADFKGPPMTNPSTLRRGLTLPAAIAVNVANMIGTGVFLKSRVMTCNVGSGWMVLAVWLAAGLLSLAGTFVYSELAAMMPDAGGDYVYVQRAYGRLAGFLNGWTNGFVRAASQAALAAGVAIFLNVALGGWLESAGPSLVSSSGGTAIVAATAQAGRFGHGGTSSGRQALPASWLACCAPKDETISAIAISVTATGPRKCASTTVATDEVAETLATSSGVST